MKLTYVFHSCFMLETERSIALFDYWKDSPDGIVKRTLSVTDKCVYIFASHFHPDHFNREIFSLEVPHGRKFTILSRDIIRRRRAKEDEADVVLRQGERFSDGIVEVKALPSTDSGVSFMLETEGLKVFHAGDLNNWQWAESPDPRQGKKMEGDFKAALRDIKGEYPEVDLAMFPVDPRIGGDFSRGARQWLETINTRIFAPMHFPPATGQAMAFGPTAEQLGTRFLYIHHEGELLL